MSVLPRLTKAKAFGGELEFTQALDKAEKLAPPSPEQLKSGLPLLLDGPEPILGSVQESTQNTGSQIPPHDSFRSRLNVRAEVPPEYRIISAWKFLYSEISRAALKKGLQVRGFLSYPEIREIGPAIGLSPDRIQQVNELRNLRNRAANEPDWTLTMTDALRYEDLVLSLLALVERGQPEGDGKAGSP